MENKMKKKYIYIKLTHFAIYVYQKLAQYCKLTILQLKFARYKNRNHCQ